MSSPQPPNKSQKAKAPTDRQILFFIIILCFICGFLLAFFAYSLQNPQKIAKEFDQSKQMLIAAKILNHQGQFQLINEKGVITPASFNNEKGIIVPLQEGQGAERATDDQIQRVAKMRIRALITDAKGALFTLDQQKINLNEYLEKNKKSGFAILPQKLLYAILPNKEEAEKITAEEIVKDLTKAEIFVIPISGFGLWAPIYGYLAISNDGNRVIGTTWYDMAETPGLGANITEASWQKQFYGKEIFQQSSEGKTDFQTTPLGITVVKGKVQDVFGTSPRSKSAVDGMSGATLTGDGVTAAYSASLAPYRPFLLRLTQKNNKKEETSK